MIFGTGLRRSSGSFAVAVAEDPHVVAEAPLDGAEAPPPAAEDPPLAAVVRPGILNFKYTP